MTIARVKPGDWAFGEKLTSAQINQLDTNVARALDKAGGDQLTGITTVGPGARVYLNAAGAAITASDGGFISSSVDGAIRTEWAGTFQLGGGATDWPTFTNTVGVAAKRSRTVMIPPVPLALNGWSLVNDGVLQGAKTNLEVLIPFAVHAGATLESVAFYVRPTGHAALPEHWPAIDVIRRAFDGPSTVVSLLGGWSEHPAETLVDWNDGLTHYSLHSCTANHTNLAPYQHTYLIKLRDEYGTDSVLGNAYLGLELVFRDIADMRFP